VPKQTLGIGAGLRLALPSARRIATRRLRGGFARALRHRSLGHGLQRLTAAEARAAILRSRLIGQSSPGKTAPVRSTPPDELRIICLGD
jgi:hypothetical protein